MIDFGALQSARGAIRQLLRLPEDEIVDLVFLSAILCNFDPDRLLPIWLVIVGSPESGKTELTSLIRSWSPVWKLPATISSGYFFSARNRKESSLPQIEAQGSRILYSDDLAGLVGDGYRDGGHLYAHLIGIHDGHLVHRTGFTPDEMVYGPKAPAERLGFIGSATELFYGFQERWFQFGSRFIVYYLPDPKQGWDDYAHLSKIAGMTDVPEKRQNAEAAVVAFLEQAVHGLESFSQVEIHKRDVDRLAAAVTLVQRVLGAGRSNATGVRLHRRAVQMVRMFAYMQSRAEADACDVSGGIRLILSQLPGREHRVIRYALEHASRPWSFSDLLDGVGGSRRIYSSAVEGLADVRILARTGAAGAVGYRFELHDKARALVDVFDPQRSIFPR